MLPAPARSLACGDARMDCRTLATTARLRECCGSQLRPAREVLVE